MKILPLILEINKKSIIIQDKFARSKYSRKFATFSKCKGSPAFVSTIKKITFHKQRRLFSERKSSSNVHLSFYE